MKKLLSRTVLLLVISNIFVLFPQSIIAADNINLVGKWVWEYNDPLKEDESNWATCDEAYVTIHSASEKQVTFDFYHQKGGGGHLYYYDTMTGERSGNIITGYTKGRKEGGTQSDDFKVTLTIKDNYLYVETYNISKDGVAFTGNFFKEENSIKVKLFNNELTFDQPPVIIDGRTLVPFRAIFEAMGATVDWNGDTRTVTSKKDSTTIRLTIGSDVMYKNDIQIYLDVPAQIINDRTMVPVRAIAEAFGAVVSWDGSTRTVYIN